MLFIVTMNEETIEQRRDRFKYYPTKQERYWKALLPLESGYRDYTHYMTSKKWREFKENLIETRGSSCELCLKKSQEFRTPASFAVHHITYKNLCNEKDEDIVLLCIHCHSSCHFSGHNLHVKIDLLEKWLLACEALGWEKSRYLEVLDKSLDNVIKHPEIFS